MKPKQIQEAMTQAIANIKRTKRMQNMKYPLTDKRNNYVWYFYFTDAEDLYYTAVLDAVVHRKKNKLIEAPQLFCFDFDYKRDAWFIDEVPELIDRIEDLFDDYYTKTVLPDLKKRGKVKK